MDKRWYFIHIAVKMDASTTLGDAILDSIKRSVGEFVGEPDGIQGILGEFRSVDDEGKAWWHHYAPEAPNAMGKP